jgi:hypothetical protein
MNKKNTQRYKILLIFFLSPNDEEETQLNTAVKKNRFALIPIVRNNPY